MGHRALLLSLLLALTSCTTPTPGEEAFLQLIGPTQHVIIPLWPESSGAPNETRQGAEEQVQWARPNFPYVLDVMRPSMVIIPPPAGITPTGTVFLFAPGGGYNRLDLANAAEFSKWAGAMGAHTALLKYRLPRVPDDAGLRIPLSDAQRAVRLLRDRADNLSINSDKVIIVGSSAGSYLAFNLANNHAEKTYAAIDDADQGSAEPNAAILMSAAYHSQQTPALQRDLHVHLELASPEQTAPVFVALRRPDNLSAGTLKALMGLREAKLPVELHIYPGGGYGGILNKYPLMEWARSCARFLVDQGLLTPAMRRAGDAWLDQKEALFRGLEDSAPGAVAQPLEVQGALGASAWNPADKRLASLAAQPALVLALWPDDGKRADDPAVLPEEALPDQSDGILRIQNVSQPSLHVWRPERPDGRAVIIYPGGGYHILAAQHEGTEIAHWLNGQGITAFVLKYRVPRRQGLPKHSVALQDALRSIRLVRSRAKDLKINPKQVGVIGFSAGGHLAALSVHQAAVESYPAIDGIDAVSARPDFVMQIYPAYLTLEREGPELDPLLRGLPNAEAYPPIFTSVAADDPFAPGALYYYLQLQQLGVPNELHVYASGGHGQGLREKGYPFSQWTAACERWLEDLKYGDTDIQWERLESLGRK